MTTPPRLARKLQDHLPPPNYGEAQSVLRDIGEDEAGSGRSRARERRPDMALRGRLMQRRGRPAPYHRGDQQRERGHHEQPTERDPSRRFQCHRRLAYRWGPSCVQSVNRRRSNPQKTGAAICRPRQKTADPISASSLRRSGRKKLPRRSRTSPATTSGRRATGWQAVPSHPDYSARSSWRAAIRSDPEFSPLAA